MKGLAGLSFDILTLRESYKSGAVRPVEVIREAYKRIAALANNPVWIHLVPEKQALGAAQELGSPANSPLFGIPFAVKDNLDVAGLPTTAGCPAFSYVAIETAPVVERLLAAGAILIGKTNLDQFATGLVGTRSPYGACTNLFDERYIAGGSSSGSAVAVSAGLVSFALGTDTAGSGRVPAAFANIIGLKPTRGALSTRGVVPACRSLDCVSIFSLTADDAETVFAISMNYDNRDPYSRRLRDPAQIPAQFRIGIPGSQILDLVENEYRAMFTQAAARFASLGHSLIQVDVQPFLSTAELLYNGPWVAERFASVGKFIKEHPHDVHPVVRDIILGGEKFSATDVFEGQYRLEELRKQTDAVWEIVDVLLLPTTPDIYRVQQVEQEPVSLNSRLGTFTNFTNLLDLAAIAVPAGFRANGLPFGITILGSAYSDLGLLALSRSYLSSLRPQLGATKVS
jgi:allophanate hydrolase